MEKLMIGILALGLVLGLSDSSEESKVKSLYKCAFVAEQLGEYKAKQNVSKKLDTYMTENNSYFKSIKSISAYLLKIGEDVRNDDLDWSGRTLKSQMYILQKTFKSDECQELYN